MRQKKKFQFQALYRIYSTHCKQVYSWMIKLNRKYFLSQDFYGPHTVISQTGLGACSRHQSNHKECHWVCPMLHPSGQTDQKSNKQKVLCIALSVFQSTFMCMRSIKTDFLYCKAKLVYIGKGSCWLCMQCIQYTVYLYQ